MIMSSRNGGRERLQSIYSFYLRNFHLLSSETSFGMSIFYLRKSLLKVEPEDIPPEIIQDFSPQNLKGGNPNMFDLVATIFMMAPFAIIFIWAVYCQILTVL